jgi:hypothetical protein
MSYAIRQEVNLQTVLWSLGSAIYTAAHYIRNIVELVVILAHMMTFEVSWEPVASAATVAIKSTVLVAVIVGCVVGAAMYPGVVLCVALLVGYAMATKGK